MTKDAYQKLFSLSRKAAVFGSISHLLEWDQETKMPKNAVGIRSLQTEQMAGVIHEIVTSDEYGNALGDLIDLDSGQLLTNDLNPQQKAAVREWRRDYLRLVKLPQEFVEEFAKACSASVFAWQETCPKNDFKSFQPHLEKLIELNRKKADFLSYDHHPYDALIEEFEPNMKTETLTTLFERLKFPLMDLLKKIQTKKDPDDSFLHKEYPHEKQLAFSKQILKDMGFEDAFSRLDESAHPMCVPIHPSDMRMATRVYPNNVLINILSCVHEGGHGLYHIHLPEEHFGSPLCESASHGIDESQSRTWETLIARSHPFWKHYFPKLQNTFTEQLRNVSLEDFYKGINIVEPSMIRVDSDEVSYNLHIMLRFELEKALLENNLSVQDLPDAWDSKMREYLSITPKAVSEGCMQDIHWSIGAIGYFPTYTLGNLYAAQFFQAFREEHSDWDVRVANGELRFISDWQKENIHHFGREYLPDDLCEKVTGSVLNEKPYLDYLTNKFTPLYQL